MNTFSLFFQDAWQVTRKLSVNYGARYATSARSTIPKRISPLSSRQGGLLFQGAGISSLYPADWKNFAPRLGFAYSQEKKTVW